MEHHISALFSPKCLHILKTIISICKIITGELNIFFFLKLFFWPFSWVKGQRDNTLTSIVHNDGSITGDWGQLLLKGTLKWQEKKRKNYKITLLNMPYLQGAFQESRHRATRNRQVKPAAVKHTQSIQNKRCYDEKLSPVMQHTLSWRSWTRFSLSQYGLF